MSTKIKQYLIPILILLFTLILSVNIHAQDDDSILVGHLTYQTGPFAEFGAHFDGVTDFTLGLINENPPLNRPLVVIHEDIGTIGEARAARKVVLFDEVDILLNPAHNYHLYREWIQGFIGDNDRPMMPSVHGGAIARDIGGVADEPLFRGSPMDSAQSVAAVVQAQASGAQDIVIMATAIEGHQLQRDAAVNAATSLGMNILEVVNVQPELSSYANAVSGIDGLEPDAILVFTSAIDGGIIVRNLADANLISTILGTTEWQSGEFVTAATLDAIEAHDAVWITGFAHTDSPAWEYYEALWMESEYADLASAGNSYNLQYYDLLNVTALAIEAAGTTDASVWADYVPQVAQSPGRVVYSYAEGIEALRNGEEIDYSGISGEMDYTETGVVSGLFGIFEWASASELVLVQRLDDVEILNLDS